MRAGLFIALGSIAIGLTALFVAGALAGATLSPLIVVLCFFPLLADAALTFLWRRTHADDRAFLYQIGIAAGAGRWRIVLAYWAASLHCGLVAIIASEVHRGAETAGPHASDAAAALTKLASYTPQFAVILLGFIFWKVSNAVRAYAQARREAAKAQSIQ